MALQAVRLPPLAGHIAVPRQWLIAQEAAEVAQVPVPSLGPRPGLGEDQLVTRVAARHRCGAGGLQFFFLS